MTWPNILQVTFLKAFTWKESSVWTVAVIMWCDCPVGPGRDEWWLNSLAPGRCGNDIKSVISELILQIEFMDTCETTFRWMPGNVFYDQWTLVQVMAWCCQATSHYRSQCWPRSISPYSITRSQWVKTSNYVDQFTCPFARFDLLLYVTSQLECLPYRSHQASM